MTRNKNEKLIIEIKREEMSEEERKEKDLQLVHELKTVLTLMNITEQVSK